MSLMFAVSGSAVVIVAGTAVLAGALVVASLGVFLGFDLFVSAAAPLLTVAGLFVSFFVARFAIERRRALLWQQRLENARQVTIESMAAVAETRDPETGGHIKRTQHYVRAIAEELRRCGIYVDTLTPSSSICYFSRRRCMTSAKWACPTTSCSSRASSPSMR